MSGSSGLEHFADELAPLAGELEVLAWRAGDGFEEGEEEDFKKRLAAATERLRFTVTTMRVAAEDLARKERIAERQEGGAR